MANFSISMWNLAMLLALINLATAYSGYNSRTQKCCNGLVLDTGDDTRSLACCGNVTYNPQTSVCCETGEVLDRPTDSSFNLKCCTNTEEQSSVLYDVMSQICCNGVAHDRPSTNGFQACCNQDLYESATQFCCNNQIYERENSQQQCCGKEQLYDTKTQMCCFNHDMFDFNNVTGYKLHDFVPGTFCCGLETYDYRKQTCCNNGIQEKEGGSCCGNQQYNYQTQVCCTEYGEIRPNHFAPVDYAIVDIVGNAKQCCGKRTYDDKKQYCCNGKGVVPKPADTNSRNLWMNCCGDQMITNPSTQVCINNKIIEKSDDPYKYLYCGEEAYNPKKQVCCDETLHDIAAFVVCCPHAKQLYDTRTHQCCYDTVEERTEDDVAAKNDACCVPGDDMNSRYHYTVVSSG